MTAPVQASSAQATVPDALANAIVWLNDAWVPLADAHVSVLDRGFIFGDGVYEVVPVYSANALANEGADAGAGASPVQSDAGASGVPRISGELDAPLDVSDVSLDAPFDAPPDAPFNVPFDAPRATHAALAARTHFPSRTLRVPFRLDHHLARLARSLHEVGIDNPLDDTGWRALIAQLVAANERAHALAPLDHALVYIQVTRGVARRNHAFPAGIRPTVFAMATPVALPTAAQREQGVRCVTAEDRRWLRCDIKSISLLGNVLMAQYAAEHGAMETLQLRDGRLSEGASSNVWVVKDGALYAPPRDHRILEGIRYGLIEELARECALRFDAREIDEAALRDADEILLSAATREILPVTQLDGHPVGNGKPGSVFGALYAAYQRAKMRAVAAVREREHEREHKQEHKQEHEQEYRQERERERKRGHNHGRQAAALRTTPQE